MREKRKEGKVWKESDISTACKRFFQTWCLARSHPCHKTSVRSASLADERHFPFFDIFLWKTNRMTFLYQEQLLTISFWYCLWKKSQYKFSFLSSEINEKHPHCSRFILIRFKAMRLREEPDPSLKVATAVDLKEYMWIFNMRKTCKRVQLKLKAFQTLHMQQKQLHVNHICSFFLDFNHQICTIMH